MDGAYQNVRVDRLMLMVCVDRYACRHLVLGVGLSLVNILKSGVFRLVCDDGIAHANQPSRDNLRS